MPSHTHKLWIQVSVILTVVLLVTACSPQPVGDPNAAQPPAAVSDSPPQPAVASDPPAQPAEPITPDVEQVFTVAVHRDSGPLNPHDTVSIFPALAMIYESLVVFNNDGTMGPGLAESWEISPDGKSYTFKLRQGVSFHDGTPFNAAAVKWNLDRWLADAAWSSIPFWNKVVKESIETPDEYTVKFSLTEPYFATLQEFTFTRPVRILSPSSVNASGEFVTPLGTGPWKVAEYVPEQRMVFVPFENYWGEKPKLDQVIFEVIPDPQARINALLSGEVNLIGGEYSGGIPLESIPVLKQSPNVSLITGEGGSTYVIGLNFTKPPFDDKRVRQAINYAIDRNIIAEELFAGYATPAKGVFPPTVPYMSFPNPDLYAFAPEKAKELLTQAGWVAGSDGILQKDGAKFETELLVDAEAFPQSKSMSEVVQAQLREVGIDAKLRLVDYGAWSDALRSSNYSMSTWLTYGPPYDPQTGLGYLFNYSLLEMSDDGTIFGDPELDALREAAFKTTTEEERQTAFTKVWDFMDKSAGCVPVVYSVRVFAIDNRVQGFKLSSTEYWLDINQVTMKAE
jgi:peptide/nickel transport system substrate-binding protein